MWHKLLERPEVENWTNGLLTFMLHLKTDYVGKLSLKNDFVLSSFKR